MECELVCERKLENSAHCAMLFGPICALGSSSRWQWALKTASPCARSTPDPSMRVRIRVLTARGAHGGRAGRDREHAGDANNARRGTYWPTGHRGDRLVNTSRR